MSFSINSPVWMVLIDRQLYFKVSEIQASFILWLWLILETHNLTQKWHLPITFLTFWWKLTWKLSREGKVCILVANLLFLLHFLQYNIWLYECWLNVFLAKGCWENITKAWDSLVLGGLQVILEKWARD